MKQFTPTKNRTSLMSNEVLEMHRYRLSLNAQKLLYGLAQSVDHTIDMFSTIEIDINGIFKYLDIESNGDRYEVVRDAVFEIHQNPLQFNYSSNKWKVIGWFETSEFDLSEGNYVKLKFTEAIKPFLLNLSGYVKIQGKYICSLSSAYATWLYPVMKMISEKYYGQHIVTIQRLKEYTFTDDAKEHPSYNVSKNATSDFLKRILGVAKNNKTKRFEILKNSPLWEINEKTDIAVSVEVLKSGRKYDRICFYVQNKESKKNKSKFDKSKFVNEIPENSGLRPVSRIPLADVYENARASGMNVYDYCKSAGYYIQGQYVYKQFKKPNQGRKRTGQLSINDMIDKSSK